MPREAAFATARRDRTLQNLWVDHGGPERIIHTLSPGNRLTLSPEIRCVHRLSSFGCRQIRRTTVTRVRDVDALAVRDGTFRGQTTAHLALEGRQTRNPAPDFGRALTLSRRTPVRRWPALPARRRGSGPCGAGPIGCARGPDGDRSIRSERRPERRAKPSRLRPLLHDLCQRVRVRGDGCVRWERKAAP